MTTEKHISMNELKMLKNLYHTTNVIVTCDNRFEARKVVDTFMVCTPQVEESEHDVLIWVVLNLMTAYTTKTIPDLGILIKDYTRNFGR